MRRNRQRVLSAAAALAGLLTACSPAPPPASSASPVPAVPASPPTNHAPKAAMSDKIQKTDEEWRKVLTAEQYEVLRQKGTERPFTGQYWNSHESGVYRCAGCGAELFTSETKYDSGCGWPSFHSPAQTNNIQTAEDRSHSMVRTEVVCKRCGGHLGHVFEDGPKPTGLRYCINSASLQFDKK